MRWSVVALALSSFWLGGCNNALVGTWESKEEFTCLGGGAQEAEFEIPDNELKGDGDVCGCSFEVEAEDKGDNEYELDFEDCNGLKLNGVECTLDDKELDCEDLFGLSDVTFEKKE